MRSVRKLHQTLALLILLCTTNFSSIPQAARASASLDTFIYLPLVTRSNCDPIPDQTYRTLAPTNPNGDPEGNYLINLALRGYEPVDKFKGLIDTGPVGDPLAPQFPGLFADHRIGVFNSVYALHRWDSTCNCPSPDLVTSPEVTVAGLATTPGETIHVPDSGYDIGGGNDVMVLYASSTRLALKYTREDDIVSGYTLYLENVCVEPSLLALYQSLNAAGRGELPALPGGQPLGRALGCEIGVAIRDAGQSRDPRVRNAWWQDR